MRSKPKELFVISLLLISAGGDARWVPPAGALPPKKAPLFYETRMNTVSFGTVLVRIGEPGLRMDFRKNGNVLVAAAPQWKVIMYNPAGKRVYYHQKDTWDGGSTAKYLQMMSRSPRDLLWVKESADGANAHYKADKAMPILSAASKKRLQRFIMRAQLVTDIETPGLPKQAISILDKTLGCPDAEGFPLSMTTTSAAREQSTFVEVSKGFKKIPFDKQIFEVPKNLEKVDSDGKVESAAAEALINDLAN